MSTFRSWLRAVLAVALILSWLLSTIAIICFVGFTYGAGWCLTIGLVAASLWGGTAVWAISDRH